MADTVNVGAAANDNTGDKLRAAFQKINARVELEKAESISRDAVETAAREAGDAGLLANINGQYLFLNPRGDWETGQSYVYTAGQRRDYFKGPDGTIYVALVTHTSTSIAADLSALKIADIDSVQLRADLGSVGVGLGADIVLNQRTDIAGAQPSSLAVHFRRSKINVARDFNLSPGADITAALREVLADGRGWYLPGTPVGLDWLISDDLPVASFDQVGEGDGVYATRIRSTVANKHGFRNGVLSANRISLSRMWIQTLGTGSPLYFPYEGPENRLMYSSKFDQLRLTAEAGNALHIANSFSLSIRNTLAESNTGHAFFVNGGNTTLLEACYALKCGDSKAGYRSLAGGAFISCNGLNSGGTNFWFGGTAADTGDVNPGSYIFAAQLINCNVEDFSRFGLKLQTQGTLDMYGGKFGRNDALSTYVAVVHADGTINARFHGNPRDDILGTRRAEAGEGVASPLAADFNRVNASAQLSWEDRNSTPRMMSTGGVNPKPMWTNAMGNVLVTMGIQGGTVAGASTVSSAVRYRLDGDSCRVWGQLTLTVKDPAMSGAIRLTGLPYTSNASAGLCGVGTVSRADRVTPTGGRTQVGCDIQSSSTFIRLMQFGGGEVTSAVLASDIGEGAILYFDITYLL